MTIRYYGCGQTKACSEGNVIFLTQKDLMEHQIKVHNLDRKQMEKLYEERKDRHE